MRTERVLRFYLAVYAFSFPSCLSLLTHHLLEVYASLLCFFQVMYAVYKGLFSSVSWHALA